MRFAFAIVSLFQGGGLQRDCLAIARLVGARGHHVKVLTTRIAAHDEAAVAGLDIEVVECNAWTNHGRNLRFSAMLREITSGEFDKVVGFDKLTNLDVLVCADPSIGFKVRQHPYLGLLPRYRALSQLEGDSFAVGSRTKLLLLDENKAVEYKAAWNPEADRLFVIPPTLSADCRHPQYRRDGTRTKVRKALGLDDDAWVWLSICSQPGTKGLDRTIDALEAFPTAHMVVIGIGATDKKAATFVRRAESIGVADRISWLGYRNDIPELLAAADLLVHPSRLDSGPKVIIEALVNGLPVVATAVCGFARHVAAARAGIVVADPFRQDHFRAALANAQDDATLRRWSEAGTAYGAQDHLYSGWSHAADLIIGDVPSATEMR